jgi:hypothetical protein
MVFQDDPTGGHAQPQLVDPGKRFDFTIKRFTRDEKGRLRTY